MSGRKLMIMTVVTLVAVAAWYAFRPERLFINQRVHEDFPTASDASKQSTLASGTFHSVAHEIGDNSKHSSCIPTAGQRLHIHRHVWDALCRIDQGQCASGVGTADYLGNRIDRSQHV